MRERRKKETRTSGQKFCGFVFRMRRCLGKRSPSRMRGRGWGPWIIVIFLESESFLAANHATIVAFEEHLSFYARLRYDLLTTRVQVSHQKKDRKGDLEHVINPHNEHYRPRDQRGENPLTFIPDQENRSFLCSTSWQIMVSMIRWHGWTSSANRLGIKKGGLMPETASPRSFRKETKNR